MYVDDLEHNTEDGLHIASLPSAWTALVAGYGGMRHHDLSRLLQLHRGESVEVRCSWDPSPLWRRLTDSDPGGWGINHLEQRPDQWRVEISRHRD
jgi:hypothetical protein